jgi:hypothetical protein
MSVSIDKARDFVYANGAIWEKALFSYLFDDGPLERLHQCLLCYKNSDGGWGHGLEHDIQCPDSHPLALEYLLTVVRDTNIPVGNILEGTVAWVEKNRNQDGSLKNPDSLLKYPYAPWWSNGGQSAPDSITGNLIKLGLCSTSLAESTGEWVESRLTIEKILANEWLFMAYHAHDYYLGLKETTPIKPFKDATIENIIHCANNIGEKSYFTLFHFAITPITEVARALPPLLLNKCLDHLASTQREDGGWDDEHGLKHWQPYVSIVILLALKNFGRL